MLDQSSKPTDTAALDPLSEMLRGLRLEGLDYARCRLTAPWGYVFAAEATAQFRFMAGAAAWLRMAGEEWQQLRDGDAALLPRGAAHVIASDPDATTRPFDWSSCARICEGMCELDAGGVDATSMLFLGAMRFSVDADHPLLQLMPALLRADELGAKDPTIHPLLAALACEMAMNRVGAAGIAARLADVLAAKVIRCWVEHGCGDAKGWTAAVRDPALGRVLNAMHRHPERDWTVPDLAAVMGASRSSFAARFVAMLGVSPGRYLVNLRMQQARYWLARDRLRIAVVAERLGYDSEASFSRAFKRVIGVPPSRMR
jgi:AraC-like DNA-binding protein